MRFITEHRVKFRDELVTQGLDGGKRAANLLKQAVEEELKSSVPTAAHHLQVIIRVYANVKGLANTYKEMDVVSEPTLDQFVRGFNMGDAMCDYIDAGNGKECSDEKVKGMVATQLRTVAGGPSVADLGKRYSNSTPQMSTVSRFSSAAALTTDTLVCSGRMPRTRQFAGGLHCSKDPLSHAN